jgi:hypothetical protein
MNADTIISALGLPDSASVNQRVPKKLLLENGAPTAADKRRISEGIEEIQWLASLKPNTIGVPDYCDDIREYLEIALLSVTLRGAAKAARLSELVHRAIPYPLFLVLLQGDQAIISLAHKRRAQNEAGKFVLDGDIFEVTVTGNTTENSPFLAALALGNQPRANLLQLYHGWIDVIVALQASQITGKFSKAATHEAAIVRREAVLKCEELVTKIVTLRNTAAKEKQIARRVELNQEIKGLELELVVAKCKL